MQERDPDGLAARRRRARWRAGHRGTREADLLIGGFAGRTLDSMDAAALDWFEALLEEQDVDILAWITGRASAPQHLAGPWMERLIATADGRPTGC